MTKVKPYKEQNSVRMSVGEPIEFYHGQVIDSGVTRIIKHAELESDCFTLSESKQRLIEKIHNYYHQA